MKTTSIFLPLLMLLSLTGCNQVESTAKLHGKTMGTSWSLTLSNPSTKAHSRQLQTQIDELLENINSLMSTWRTDSEISRFNTSSPTIGGSFRSHGITPGRTVGIWTHPSLAGNS